MTGVDPSWATLPVVLRTKRVRHVPRAFTLVELLVALGLFAVTVGLIAELFLIASRQQARTITAMRLQGDARLIIETIARELRSGTIDFRSGTLALTNGDGVAVWFERVTMGCPTDAHACLRIGRDENSNGMIEPEEWAPMTSAGVTVEMFAFRTAPVVDPFAWDAVAGRFAANEQPRVTVSLRLAMAHRGFTSPRTLDVQTTVVSRVYRR